MKFNDHRMHCIVLWGLILAFLSLNRLDVEALGVTGTFSSRDFVMVPGESFRSSSVYVTFINTGQDPLTLELSAKAPEGVQLELEETHLSLQPETSIKIPISISISNEAVAGQWILGLSATAQSSGNSGIRLVGSAELRAPLTILGESATLDLRTVTLDKQAFPTELRLYRVEADGSSRIAAEGRDGQLEKRIATGTYRLEIFAQSALLLSEDLVLKDQDHLEKTYELSPIVFESFNCQPLTSVQERLKCSFHIENFHQSQNDLNLELVVTQDGKTIDQIILEDHWFLESGSTRDDFEYSPVSGWKDGNYGLSLNILDSNGRIWDQTDSRTLIIQQEEKKPHLWIWLLMGILLFGSIMISRKLNQRSS